MTFPILFLGVIYMVGVSMFIREIGLIKGEVILKDIGYGLIWPFVFSFWIIKTIVEH